METTTKENINAVAAEFTRILKQWAAEKPGAWETMAKANAAETDGNICHSHDFCDANQAMIDAFESVLGREPVVNEDADGALMMSAWKAAKLIWQASKAKLTVAKLTVAMTTRGGRKLLVGRDLDALRASGDHRELERYQDEAGTAVIICSMDEREEFEGEEGVALESDTLSATDFAEFAEWLMKNIGLRVESFTVEGTK